MENRFTPVFRAIIKDKNELRVIMRFEVAATTAVHAQVKVHKFIEEVHPVVRDWGYTLTLKRIIRNHTEATVLV